jgi:hypothetical protein
MEDPAVSMVDLDERTQLMKIQILQEAEMDFASALQVRSQSHLGFHIKAHSSSFYLKGSRIEVL